MTTTTINESPKKADLDGLNNAEWFALKKADGKTYDLLKELRGHGIKDTEDFKNFREALLSDEPEPEASEAESEPKADVLSCLEKWDYIQKLDIKIEWVADRLIPKKSITVIFGKGGIGKTWFTLDMARSIGSGIPFLGLTTIKIPVIFVDFENPLAVLNTRTQKLGDAEGVFFWRANNEKLKPPKLDSKDWELYKNLPKESVIIFDTLRAAHSKDENASDGMALIMGRLKELRDMGFTVILLHHTAKNFDKMAKGSTAIVDLADHILGMTLVRKKQDGQEIVIDDEDNEEDTIYRVGVREKTRFEPYHVYLTLNPDRGLELAPDPQENILKEMRNILTGHSQMTKTAFTEACKRLGAINKIRKLVEIGQGRYWAIERRPDQKNAQIVTPKNSVLQFYAPLGAVKLKNCPESPQNGSEKLDTAKNAKTLDSVEFDSFTGGGCKTVKLDLKEGEL